jgi:hypothetical protein
VDVREQDRETDRAQGSIPSPDSDIVGPGTGGSPTSAGAADASSQAEAAADEDVAALVEDLRQDDGDARVDIREAAEETGTGTDR